jgi:hypothetical protein
MGGGFDVTDRELAQFELEQTQRKLGRVLVPPGSRAEAEMQLNQRLTGEISKAPAEKVIMKMDQAPKASSRKQAANQLRRTQKLLSNASFKRNSSPEAPSISPYPKRDAQNTRREDLLAAIKRLLDRKDELTVADIAKALNIDAKYAMELCKELEKAGLADLE